MNAVYRQGVYYQWNVLYHPLMFTVHVGAAENERRPVHIPPLASLPQEFLVSLSAWEYVFAAPPSSTLHQWCLSSGVGDH